jgi:endonuclease YncB( thermonuclease family)
MLVAAAWYLEEIVDSGERVPLDAKHIITADGDSFTVGDRKLRLDGIDAPEYRQTCQDANGVIWECGKAARASLDKMLRAPGLVCDAAARDQYSRFIATCSSANVPDLAAAQTALGWAMSDEYYGIRSYGDEEDAARAAKRGIWAGKFVRPSDWRQLKAARQ